MTVVFYKEIDMNRFKINMLIMGLCIAGTANAATLVDLRHESVNVLHPLMATSSSTALAPIRTDIDFNHTKHQRLQQTYQGYPVWDAIAIVHTPETTALHQQTSMDGKIYHGLEKDLASAKSEWLNTTQQTKALQLAQTTFTQKTGRTYPAFEDESVKVIVYVDEKKQAHFGFLTSFFVDDDETGAHRPTMIIDAATLHIYRQWDQVMTADKPSNSEGGGIGGNEKTHELVYDGGSKQWFSLNLQSMQKVTNGKPSLYCYLQNDAIVVTDNRRQIPISGICNPINGTHNNLPWLSQDNNGTRWLDDGVNGGYSPSLDALYAAIAIKQLYQDWYHIPVLTTDGTTPMKLVMRVHYGRHFGNAFWDGKKMNFGDGNQMLYPLTSLDVSAHEISHGFTQQHSNLDTSNNQMAALHESFSDMASAAIEYYFTQSNTWDVGRSVFKDDRAIRYMDQPTKDNQSIDHMKNYNDDLDPHLVAGVTNKAFYLIATSPNWNTQMAFNIMVKANMNYWSSSMSTIAEAACGVISATKDYDYPVNDVQNAFNQVGVDTSNC